jgi:Tol biopolymer transport system component
MDFARQIADALAAAHASRIAHRDLKPGNIMITPESRIKVLDFGLAKRSMADGALLAEAGAATRTQLTASGMILGTVGYMSPEQAQGKPVDGRTDIFSFGTLLYELLTGRRPFQREDKLSTLAAILRDEPEPMERGLPEPVERLVMRCLHKDPDCRFQNGGELRAALQDLKDESAPVRAAPRVVPRRRMHWWIPVSIAAAAVIAAFLVWAPWRRETAMALSAPVQITFDGGIAATPAISADGKLFAFASDRAERGNLDIWLQQMKGGTPVPLTSRPGVEYNPQFSSDGTRLYYLTGENEIEEMPALGGPARNVLREAGPFTVSSNNELAFFRRLPVAQPGPMFVAPAGGGTPQPWQPECKATARPLWSADGKALFFFGQCGRDQAGGYVAPRRGGKPVRVCDAQSKPVPNVKAGPFGGAMLFPTANGILRVGPDGSPNLIQSSVNQLGATIDPAGNLMFTSGEHTSSIWSATGGLENTTPQEIVTGIGHFGASRDGTTLVYGRLVSQQSGELVVRNLRSGKERVFAEHELLNVNHGSIWPQVSPDGRHVYYRLAAGGRGGESGHFVLRLDTGEVKKVATIEEFQLGSDWSSDGKRVLGECAGQRVGICEMAPESGAVRKVFVHTSDQLLYPSQSWDGRWMVFGRRKPGGVAGIWVARATANGIESDAQWHEISPPKTDNSRPRFSADGTSVYYVLGQGGMRQFAVQRIDPRTGAASGQVALPLRGPIEMPVLRAGSGPYPLISVTAAGVYYSAIATRGHLWMSRLQ